jgi:nucleotide-binding universal stress UspA family protein
MRVLFPVSGRESAAYFREAARLISGDVTALFIVHVVDEERRAGLERGRERFLERRPLAPHRRTEVEAAETEAADAAIDRAAEALAAAGVLQGGAPERVVLRGKTNDAVRDLAERWRADLVVVRGRGGRPGPHSVGKTARFLLDHAPRAALLVRDPGDGDRG